MNRFLKRLPLIVVTIVLLIVGCSILPEPTPSATPTPVPTSTPVITAEDVGRAFLKAWSDGDYVAMYNLVAPSRKETVTQEQFVTRYKNIAVEGTFRTIKTMVNSARVQGDDAEIKFSFTIETNAAGLIQNDNVIPLRRENNRWGVLWSPAVILPQLGGGGSVRFFPEASARGEIFDSKNRPITQPQMLVVVDVVPVEMKNEAQVLANLSRVLGKPASAIKSAYSNSPGDWRTEVGTFPREQLKANLEALSLPGIKIDRTRAQRTYPFATLAAHAIGYVGQVSAEELARYAVRGYREGDLIGKAGLELWGEQELAGTRGGKLTVVAPSGAISATISSLPAKQSQHIYTTLDMDLQKIAEEALGARLGAVVVLDVSNGNILAIASHPTWDPNKLSRNMTVADFRALLNDPGDPLVNRAALGGFPPGSVFKVVAYTAAIEKGLYSSTSLFNDPGFWDGLGENFRKYCWTWTPTNKKGHGAISLSNALVQSCDVAFYTVGQKLDQLDRNVLPTYARAFGLGSPTGTEITESPGIVPDPNQGLWRPGDPINLVIGQGNMLTTPLQIANMMAAIANGGTLYTPHIVTRIANLAEGTEKVMPPEVRGKLPISAPTLASLREALKRVTTDKDGTAYTAFRGSKVVVAGKTGTAEVTKEGEPHSWFAGYAPADNPKIAIVVMAEHGGEGSKTAAPIFREIAEKYFALPKK